ncbi:RNA polymerase sigma factor [Promicromonospora sp. CA-289599]|uniref:RNA polymerase sigma factor n=1 Tax=Promicromonospora sp. CA-289599 TaxID=3240014 RepID=UPI003D91C315
MSAETVPRLSTWAGATVPIGVVTAPQIMTDAAVIAAADQDSERFAMLYDRYAAGLYRYAYRRVGGEHAEDVVAETFAVAFRRRNTYDRSRPDARPWLYGIATKEIARWHRSEEARLRAWARSDVGHTEESPADRVAERVSASAARPELAEALRQLAPGDRDVLLLEAWGDLTQEQIAQTLGIRPGTARSRLHRARRRVRAALGAGATDELEAGR